MKQLLINGKLNWDLLPYGTILYIHKGIEIPTLNMDFFLVEQRKGYLDCIRSPNKVNREFWSGYLIPDEGDLSFLHLDIQFIAKKISLVCSELVSILCKKKVLTQITITIIQQGYQQLSIHQFRLMTDASVKTICLSEYFGNSLRN